MEQAILERLRRSCAQLARELKSAGTLKGEGELAVRIVWDADEIHVIETIPVDITLDTKEVTATPNIKKRKQ